MRRILTFMVAILCACMVAQAHQTVNKSKKNVRKSELRIATFNLRMDTPKDGVNAWPNRKEMVKDLVRFYDFDIFGTQEAFKHMLDDIKTDAYEYIGRGRDDGKEGGEHSTNRRALTCLNMATSGIRRLLTNQDWDGMPCATVFAHGENSVTRRTEKYSSCSIPTSTTKELWHVVSLQNY